MAEGKWIPRRRDYEMENKGLTQKQENAKIHPLLPNLKEVLKAESKAQALASAPSAGLEVKEAPKQVSAPDPLRAKSMSVAPQMDDPLRSASVVAKPVVNDPLRADSSASPQKFQSMASVASPRASVTTQDTSSQQGNTTSTGSTDGESSDNAMWLDSKEVKKKVAKLPGEFEPWKEKKSKILTKYTTNKKIPVSANFLPDDVKENAAPPKAVDQAKSRLEQLEIEQAQTQEAKNFLTQKEYIAHIEEQHTRLKKAWEDGERVLSLKIAIQCAKLLGDTTVPQFYPSMYVLLTDILDTFGELVFTRIKRKGVQIMTASGQMKATALPADFKSGDVSLQAKETCKNWFYKTACIRELLPRLYIDLALIKSYRFLEDGPFSDLLLRTAKMIRGIGDPLCANYARAYLATKALDLAASFTERPPPAGWMDQGSRDAILQAYEDLMYGWKHQKATNWADVTVVEKKKIKLDEYIDLSSPALEWILQNVGWGASEEMFYATTEQYKESCNSSVVLVQILGHFKASLVSKHAQSMTALMKACDENEMVLKSKLYLALGRALVESPPPKSQQLPLLNEVWRVVTKVQNPEDYMEIAEVFVQYLLMNFSDKEVNTFLKDVIKHVKKDQAYLRLQDKLQNMAEKIMEHTQDIDGALAMDNFLPLVDLLEKKAKFDAAKVILTKFAQTKQGTISDPVIIHTLFDVSRSLHDSIDSLSFDDDRRQISTLIIEFIRKIDFGRDLERQLNLYVDFRQSFTNLDAVTQELVLRVALLATKAHRFKKGRHSKETAGFVKACLAYCHITIPSLDDIFARLRLLLLCGEVGLVNQMIVQSEAFLKAAIQLIELVPAYTEVYQKRVPTEDDLVSFLRNFASFLLLFPGHPEHGPFYLVKGLLNQLEKYEAWKTGSQGKARVYMGIVQLFCTYYQSQFPYHIERVESNDALYGGHSDYKKSICSFIDGLIEKVLTTLTEVGEGGDLVARKKQGTLALEFANMLITCVEMNPNSATMVVKLFQLAKKSEAVDPAYLRNTLEHVSSQKGSWYQDVAGKITSMTGVTLG